MTAAVCNRGCDVAVRRVSGWLVFVVSVCVFVFVLGVGCGSAFAFGEGAGWELMARTHPTYLPPAGKGTIEISVFNVGAAASEGTITVTDVLPLGVTATAAGELDGENAPQNGGSPKIGHKRWDCTGNGAGGGVEGASVVSCTNDPRELFEFDGGGGAPTPEEPNIQPQIGIAVDAGSAASGLVNHVTIAGGGALTAASTEEPVTISSSTPPFGFVSWDTWLSNADGTLDTQAGSHPYETTFAFDLAQAISPSEATGTYVAGGEPRDIEVQFPPGFVVNPVAVPQCTRPQLDNNACPQASIVGTSTVYLTNGEEIGMQVLNMVPPPGIPAELGLNFGGILTFFDGGVRTGGDDGISAHADRIPQRGIIAAVVTLWNIPGEASHSRWRAGDVGGCTEAIPECKPEVAIVKPFLTVPTACGQSEPFLIRADTWQNTSVTSVATSDLHDANGFPAGFAGCEHLQFGPLITTSPDTARSDTPAGLTVEVMPPVGGLEEPEQLGTADIQDTTVTLPEGLVINPGQAAGLQACGASQDGLTSETEKNEGRENDGPASCPNASKVGTVTIKTPLLEGAAEKQLEGNVYVLQSNPPELKLLVAASADGVNLKLVGVVHLNEHTGQLTTKFEGTPELPFTNFKLSFSGGAQAALDTPVQCGSYGRAQGFAASFVPWSSPFVPDFSAEANFAITEGPGGEACPSNPLPFSPSMIAGATTDLAGGYTNFSLLLQRQDGQQRIEKLQFKEPPGLSGMISRVPLCPEPQAAQGSCPETSHIGHAVVASGPGPYPLVIPQPGQPESPIYLTGPYNGAPFGLSIVTHVIAGPFNLGTIITRAKIELDPKTLQVTITTDPLPQIVDGVPTDLRSINAIIDRPGFLFNPTNCNPQQFTGTATSAQGTSTPISSPFQVGSCQTLKFAPDFKVTTSGKTSKENGASLTAKIVYPTTPPSSTQATTYAGIASAKVDLPKQLPSRLTTLHGACLAATFETNPANCPPTSIVGHARVITPALPVPLLGPAYFVSHGGEAFPSLTIVLQGYGITAELIGSTFIRNGITSSTFKATPDAPFTLFELTLPQGPHSALAANTNLCNTKNNLNMPTQFTAQNNLTIKQTTKITVTNCPTQKPAHKHNTKHTNNKH